MKRKEEKSGGVPLRALSCALLVIAAGVSVALLYAAYRAAAADMQTASAGLLLLIGRQRALIIALLAVMLAIVLLNSILVIWPLKKSVSDVREQRAIPVEGAREFRALAEACNTVFEENRQSREKLSYDATHDILTGLYNRSAYEALYRSVDEASVALVLADVDEFKAINDAYGHELGDRVLQSVASVLLSSFRSDDCVCRIGGDEFAVIMTNIDSTLAGAVKQKLRRVNERLGRPESGLPAVSLSIGVAFGDRVSGEETLFKNADAALYRVKRNGRSGCEFYDEKEA